MADNEGVIGNTALSEDTVVKTNVKTLLWVSIGLFSLLMSMFTVFYFDMRSRDAATNDKMKETAELLEEEVEETVSEKLEKFEERQQAIKDDIGTIRGDIKVILDRTRRSGNNASTSTINDATPPPSSSVPPG